MGLKRNGKVGVSRMENNKKPAQGNGQSNLFMVPFALFFTHSDLHIMLYFEGHPEYEAVEALIRKREDGTDFIHVIMTRNDQRQVDYINDRDQVASVLAAGGKREVHYRRMKYVHTMQKGKPHVFLRYTTSRSEIVEMDFQCAGKPSPKHGGLTDPEDHSKDTSLPVMYREASALASKKSKISFNGVSYKIPVKVHIPVFFTGLKGFYSRDFSMGIFRTITEPMETLCLPTDYSVGQSWEYTSSVGKSVYEIVDKVGNTLTVKQGNTKIYAEVQGNAFYIHRIEKTGGNSGKGLFIITFTPALPVGMYEDFTCTPVNFAIFMDKSQDLLQGKVNITAEGNRVNYQLLPEIPAWAAARPVYSVIEKVGNGFVLTAGIKGSDKP